MQGAPTPLADWVVVLPVLVPLLGAALLLLVARWARGLAVLGTLVVGVGDSLLLARVLAHGPLSMTMGRWLPPFGISFTADATGAGFALAAALVTLAVLIAAPAEAGRRGVSFHALVLLLLAGVDGAFLTGDLFNLYVWFEVMLIASLGLLAFSATPLALDGAVKYGLVNFIGTSIFLLALGLLYGTLGTLNMADIVGTARQAPPAIIGAIAALLLLAFGIKSAAFPVNAWLPASYHTPPAGVSALLGGLLTKVGVYALLRTLVLVLPLERDLLHLPLAIVAGATLLLAPLGVLAETSLRRAIGYLLIGGIGTVLAGIALPGMLGIAGAVIYIVNAMLTIGALYLVAGLVEKVTGETDIGRMGGLFPIRPALSLLFLLLVVTLAGVPPFLGFWPKLLLLEAAVSQFSPAAPSIDPAALPLAICLLLNALLTLIAGVRLWSKVFWSERPSGAAPPVEAPADRRAYAMAFAAAAGLGLIVAALGFWPAPVLAFGRIAALGLLDPARYIAAVGLAGTP